MIELFSQKALSFWRKTSIVFPEKFYHFLSKDLSFSGTTLSTLKVLGVGGRLGGVAARDI